MNPQDEAADIVRDKMLEDGRSAMRELGKATAEYYFGLTDQGLSREEALQLAGDYSHGLGVGHASGDYEVED